MKKITISQGMQFGRLSVVQEAHRTGDQRRRLECLCECGETVVVVLDALRSGLTRSCGCLRKDKATVHGKYRTAEYRAWASMIDRCGNRNGKCWKNYGGRGIRVCDKWRCSFNDFLLDVGMRPSQKHSLDRFPDKNGNYEPGNVRWATMSEQLLNQRRNRMVVYCGRLLPATEAARRAGLSPACVMERLKRGWKGDDLFKPAGKNGKN